MATIHGRNAIVYLGSGGAAITLTEAAEFTLNTNAQEVDDPAFGDLWRTKLRGILEWSGSLTGNFDTAQDLAFQASIASTSVRIYIYPDRATAARYYYGSIWAKLSTGMGVAKKGDMGLTWDGDGALTQA